MHGVTFHVETKKTHTAYTDEFFADLHATEEQLRKAIAPVGGEYDGNGVGLGEVSFYLCGPDADTLFDAVLPIIDEYAAPGWMAYLRYGDYPKNETDPDPRVAIRES